MRKYANHIMWTVFIILQVLDLATTYWAFRMGGLELNLMFAMLAKQFPGEYQILVISAAKILGITICIICMRRLANARSLWMANGLFTLVVLWNLHIISQLGKA